MNAAPCYGRRRPRFAPMSHCCTRVHIRTPEQPAMLCQLRQQAKLWELCRWKTFTAAWRRPTRLCRTEYRPCLVRRQAAEAPVAREHPSSTPVRRGRCRQREEVGRESSCLMLSIRSRMLVGLPNPKAGEVRASFCQPFDFARRPRWRSPGRPKAAGVAADGLRLDWLPGQDSNLQPRGYEMPPRFREARTISSPWAAPWIPARPVGGGRFPRTAPPAAPPGYDLAV